MMRSIMKGRSVEEREVIYFRMAFIWGVLGGMFAAVSYIGGSPIREIGGAIGGILLLYSLYLCLRSIQYGRKADSEGDTA